MHEEVFFWFLGLLKPLLSFDTRRKSLLLFLRHAGFGILIFLLLGSRLLLHPFPVAGILTLFVDRPHDVLQLEHDLGADLSILLQVRNLALTLLDHPLVDAGLVSDDVAVACRCVLGP